MRKGITSSVFILLFAMFAGSVMAGDKSACDDDLKGFKEFKSLYGLCVAYWNANADSQERILELYRAKAIKLNAPDFLLDPPGYEELISCPCWAELTDDQICNLGEDSFSPSDDGSGGVLWLMSPDMSGVHILSGVRDQCAHQFWDAKSFLTTDLEDEKELPADLAKACREEIEALGEYCKL